MVFDIRALDGLDFDEGKERFEFYQESLLDLFLSTPEGQSLAAEYGDTGFWAAQLLYYGFYYEGITLPRMSLSDVRTIITDLFPRKISLSGPEDAEGAVGELVAFWRFLEREFGLKQANKIIRYLEGIESQFPAMMTDSSKFGIAKSFFMIGQKTGFDMSSQEGVDAFTAYYNANMIEQQSQPHFDIIDVPHSDHKHRTERKRKRKMARASRNRNRKRK